MITQAMVLAAGKGQRLRPLTDHTPKPLIQVKGKAMIDQALDHLVEAGITRCVVNTHYLADQIHDHLRNRAKPEITISHELELLDTGGGVAKALPYFKGEPFFAVNADIWWEDWGECCFKRLYQAWDPEKMDVLMLLIPRENAIGFTGAGDYFLSPDGRVRYRGEQLQAPTIFSGIRILHPRLLEDQPIHPFSVVPFFHEAEKRGRLYGLIHKGPWGDIGTIESLKMIEEYDTQSP